MEFEQVLGILESEGKLRRKRTRTLYWILGGLVGLQAAGLGYMMASGKESLFGAIIAMAPMICFLGVSMGMTTTAKSALLEASTSRDPRLVGHLVEALTSGDPEVVRAASRCLVDILPTLGENEEPLDTVQHAALLHGLASADVRLTTEAVRALRFIGRKETIPILESISRGQSSMVARDASGRISALALESLGDLRFRLGKEMIQQRIAELDALRVASSEVEAAVSTRT